MRTRTALALGGAALAAAAGAVVITFTSDHDTSPWFTSVLIASVGLAFVAAGLIAWRRRPANRTGLLMTLTGFTWFLGALSGANDATIFTTGMVLGNVAVGFLAWLILGYPQGRLVAPVHKVIVGAVFLEVTLLPLLVHLFGNPYSCDRACPGNVLLVSENDTIEDALVGVYDGVGVALAIAVLAVLVRRWMRASAPQRRALFPVYAAGGFAVLALAASVVVPDLVDGSDRTVAILVVVTLIGVPAGFLAGLLQSRLARAGVARLLLEVPDDPSPGEAQAAIRRLLQDPTLELVLRDDERDAFVDAEGRTVEPRRPGRAVTYIGYENEEPVGALVHDPALLAEPEFLEEVAAMLRIAAAKDRMLRVARASERRYRALVDAIPDVIYRVSRDGSYLDHHAADDEDLATAPETLPGSNVRDVLPHDIAEMILAGIERALATGEPQTVEYRLQRPKGLRESETRIVRSGADEVVIIVRDVTTRKTAERHSRALLAAIPDVMYRMRRDGTYLTVHANDPRDLPAPAEEMIGKTIYDIAPRELADQVVAAIEHSLARRGPETLEFTAQRPGRGGLRDIEARAVPSGDDEVVVILRDVTERNAAERRTRALLAAIPDTMYRLRRDGTYLDFHTNDPRDLVANPEQIVGAKLQDLAPPRLVDRLMAAIERTLVSGGVELVAYDIERAGKGQRHVEARVVKSGDDEAVGIVQDVTERKQHELQIERERDFVRNVVRVAPSIFCVIDDEGRIDRFNDETERLTGLRDDSHVRGRRFWDAFLPPEDETVARDALEEVKLTGVTTERECDWLDSRSGSRRTVTWALTPIADQFGRPRYLLTGLDITERKRQEAARLRERELADLLAELTPQLLPFVDAEGRVPDTAGFNKAFIDVMGWTGADAAGRVFWEEFVSPDDADAFREAFLHAVRTGSQEVYESEWVTRDGTKLLVEWTVVPVRDPGTGNAYYMISGTDITRRKKQEEELRASRQRLVEAGDQERRRLERNLHDGAQQRLVSLSIALRLATSKLRADPGTAEDLMRTANEELTHALEELRELARGIHPAILSDRGLTPALMGIASRAPIDVDLETPDERFPEPVEAAAYYVVSEALANIGKYAQATRVQVSVRRQDGHAHVEVVDDGIGGADATRGTGLLGLADRVEALGGRLHVVSPRGRGTTIRAVIPVAPAAPPK